MIDVDPEDYTGIPGMRSVDGTMMCIPCADEYNVARASGFDDLQEETKPGPGRSKYRYDREMKRYYDEVANMSKGHCGSGK